METNNDKFIDLAKTALFGALIGILGFRLLAFILTFFPFLFMESSIKEGILPTILAMCASVFLVGLVTGAMPALLLLGLYLPMVLVFHYAIKSNKNFWTVLILMVIILLITYVSIAFGLINNLDLTNVDGIVDEVLNRQGQVLSDQMNMTDLEVKRFEESFRNIFDLTINLIPSALIINAIFTAYINYLIAGRRLLANQILIVQPPILANLKVPRQVIIIAGIVFGLGLLVNNMEIDLPFDIIYNAMVVFGFIYFINGLATVSLFLLSYKVSGFIRFIIFFLLISISVLTIATIILGLIDSLFDLRRPRGSDSNDG